jgi:hypothetical protein
LSLNPFTAAGIMAGIPYSFIGGLNPFFSHFPVPTMSTISGWGMTVYGSRNNGRLVM